MIRLKEGELEKKYRRTSGLHDIKIYLARTVMLMNVHSGSKSTIY